MPGSGEAAAVERVPFAYAILRLVPRVERGERVNVGVVVFCRQRGGYLAARTGIDPARVRALAPDLELEDVREQLAAIEAVAAGDPAGGAVAAMDPSDRFGWIVAPASTIIQPSEVHTGLCSDPPAQLDALYGKLVG